MRPDVKFAILMGFLFALGTIWYFTGRSKPKNLQVRSSVEGYQPPPATATPTPTATATAVVVAPPAPTATPIRRPTRQLPGSLVPSRPTANPTPGGAPSRPSPTPPAVPSATPTPRPTPTPVRQRPIIHVIGPNETFSSLAERYYGDSKYWRRIAAANPEVDPRALAVGTKLVIEPADWFDRSGRRRVRGVTPTPTATVAPVRNSYVVQRGDTLMKIAREVYGDTRRWRDIHRANKLIIGDDPRNLRPGMKLRIPP